MAKFELSDAVDLFSEQTTNITSLWTVYVAATFAAAVYRSQVSSIDVGQLSAILITVTIGFWAFTLGHLTLILQAIKINKAVSLDIASVLIPLPNNEAPKFENTLRTLCKTANPQWISICAHLIIDVCVTVTLLLPVALSELHRLSVGSP